MGLETGGDRGRRVAAGVHDVLVVVELGVVEKSLNAGLNKAPGTSIERLLLRPHDGLGVLVGVEVLLQLLPGEGVKLLDTGDGHVVDLVVGAVLVQGGVDLATANDNTVDLLGGLDVARLVGGVGQERLEVGLGTSELFDAGASQGVAKEGLGEEDDEGWESVSIIC